MAQQGERGDELELIAPLVDYHTREMGQVAGRLMVTLSLLTDLENSYGWDRQPDQHRETVRYARLLVSSVFRLITLTEAGQDDEMDIARGLDEQQQRFGLGGKGPSGHE